MTRTLTDASTFDDPITVLSDGEPLDSAHIGGAAPGASSQGLANRTRWLKDRAGAASGVATLDAQSRPVQVARFGTVSVVDAQAVAVFHTTSSAYVDVTGTILTVATTGVQIVGDMLDVYFDCFLDGNVGAGPDDVYVKAQYSKDSGVTWSDVAGTEKHINAFGNTAGLPQFTGYVSSRARIALGAPSASQTLQIKLRARNAGGSVNIGVTPNSISAQLVRP